MQYTNDDLVHNCLSTLAQIDDKGMINVCEACEMFSAGKFFLVGTLMKENKIYHY
jgi:hypothetical protein